MTRWIPALASVGLVSLMLIPAPGFWGLLIGVACCLAIAVSAFLWLLDRLATRFAEVLERRANRPRLHAGSGMVRKTGTKPSPAPGPSPVRAPAQAAAPHRPAGRLEVLGRR